MLYHPPLKHRFGIFPVADGNHSEIFGERVHRLGADAVQPHRKLKDFIIVLRPGVDDRHAFHDLPERNAASIIPHGNFIVLQKRIDAVSVSHNELIDGVIEHFF